MFSHIHYETEQIKSYLNIYSVSVYTFYGFFNPSLKDQSLNGIICTLQELSDLEYAIFSLNRPLGWFCIEVVRFVCEGLCVVPQPLAVVCKRPIPHIRTTGNLYLFIFKWWRMAAPQYWTLFNYYLYPDTWQLLFLYVLQEKKMLSYYLTAYF